LDQRIEGGFGNGPWGGFRSPFGWFGESALGPDRKGPPPHYTQHEPPFPRSSAKPFVLSVELHLSLQRNFDRLVFPRIVPLSPWSIRSSLFGTPPLVLPPPPHSILVDRDLTGCDCVLNAFFFAPKRPTQFCSFGGPFRFAPQLPPWVPSPFERNPQLMFPYPFPQIVAGPFFGWPPPRKTP